MMRKTFLLQAACGLFIVSTPITSAHASAPAGAKPDGLGVPDVLLADEELSDLRGGEAIVIANQTMSSITAGNNIGGDAIGGGVSLSDSALSSFTGFGNIVINTGSQVSLQSGMNVTININQ